MQLQINPADEVPIYRQIVHQVRAAVAGGYLKAGDKLPSHRELGEELVVAPLTVKKAYEVLERDGVVETADLRLQLAEAQSYLAGVAEAATDERTPIDWTVAEGRPAEEITQFVKENDVDLISLTAFGAAAGLVMFVFAVYRLQHATEKASS